MTFRWITAGSPEGGTGTAGVSLHIQNTESQAKIELIPPCAGLPQFEQAIAELKKELDAQLKEAEAAFEAMKPDHGEVVHSPEEVWERMKTLATDQEMFDFFNSLELSLRQQTAEHILTRVSLFSGRGPVFAEHFDQDSQSLI